MVIVVINGAEIFSRYALNQSLFFVYEITILLANWMYFVGFCLVFNRDRDIEIEFFMNLFPASVKRLMHLITQAAIIYFLMILGYYTFDLLIIQSRHSTEGLNIPNHYFSMPIFVSTASIIIASIKKILTIYLTGEREPEVA